jgi:hypothetical protein
MRTTIQQIAASLVGYAIRRRFASIRYNDTDHSFCDQFPWFLLRERIRTDCDEAGIGFEDASGEVPPKSQAPLADT